MNKKSKEHNLFELSPKSSVGEKIDFLEGKFLAIEVNLGTMKDCSIKIREIIKKLKENKNTANATENIVDIYDIVMSFNEMKQTKKNLISQIDKFGDDLYDIFPYFAQKKGKQ